MKINKQDEYGLRILLRIARANHEVGLSIPQLSELEGISQPYVGKITRTLRMSGLIQSTRGQKGGYVLAKTPAEITIKESIDALGGSMFPKDFCGDHSGTMKFCTNSVDCSIRSLWKMIQLTLDHVLVDITLADLLNTESDTQNSLATLTNGILQASPRPTIAAETVS